MVGLLQVCVAVSAASLDPNGVRGTDALTGSQGTGRPIFGRPAFGPHSAESQRGELGKAQTQLHHGLHTLYFTVYQ